MNRGQMQESSSAAVAPAIPWRMRADLIVRRQDSGAWVVKDPLTLTYVRLNDQEMALLRSLNGRRSASQLLQALQKTWPDSALTMEDVSDFLGQLIGSQLVVATQPLHRSNSSSGRNSPAPGYWLSRISGLLRLRVRLVDPAPWLDACKPLIPAKFLPAIAVAAGAVVVTALCLVILRFDVFVGNLPNPLDFFGPDNLLLLLVVFVLVKLLHEAGHAIAARYYGAECHEAGIMFMLLTPIFYTNVSDAWMLDRRSRLLITSAGILVECFVASVAAILWFFAAPGIFKALLANSMVICTFGTILFNGNPLLRYDGYFLLVDAVGQPNLAQRSSHRVRLLLEDLLLGRRPESYVSGDRFLLAYGLVAGLYRTFLAVLILSMLSHLFDAWDLRILGTAVMLVAALPLALMPLWTFAAGLVTELSMRSHRRMRLLRCVVILAAVLAVALVPLPQSIIFPAVVEPSGTPVFASLTGRLNSSVRYGDFVERSSIVANLIDPDLQRQRLKYEGAVRLQEARLRAMELRRQEMTASASLPEARSLLETSKMRLEEFAGELSRLDVIAPVSGTLMPPRARTYSEHDVVLSQWGGFPLDAGNQGAMIQQGTLLGIVGESSNCELLLQLNSNDAALLRLSQAVEFQSTGNSGTTWHGVITKIAPLSDEDVPAELIVAGLTRPPSVADDGPDFKHWQAVAKLKIPDGSTAPILYSTGIVRVYVEPVSIVSRIQRFLSQAFRSQAN